VKKNTSGLPPAIKPRRSINSRLNETDSSTLNETASSIGLDDDSNTSKRPPVAKPRGSINSTLNETASSTGLYDDSNTSKRPPVAKRRTSITKSTLNETASSTLNGTASSILFEDDSNENEGTFTSSIEPDKNRSSTPINAGQHTDFSSLNNVSIINSDDRQVAPTSSRAVVVKPSLVVAKRTPTEKDRQIDEHLKSAQQFLSSVCTTLIGQIPASFAIAGPHGGIAAAAVAGGSEALSVLIFAVRKVLQVHSGEKVSEKDLLKSGLKGLLKRVDWLKQNPRKALAIFALAANRTLRGKPAQRDKVAALITEIDKKLAVKFPRISEDERPQLDIESRDNEVVTAALLALEETSNNNE